MKIKLSDLRKKNPGPGHHKLPEDVGTITTNTTRSKKSGKYSTKIRLIFHKSMLPEGREWKRVDVGMDTSTNEITIVGVDDDDTSGWRLMAPDEVRGYRYNVCFKLPKGFTLPDTQQCKVIRKKNRLVYLGAKFKIDFEQAGLKDEW